MCIPDNDKAFITLLLHFEETDCRGDDFYGRRACKSGSLVPKSYIVAQRWSCTAYFTLRRNISETKSSYARISLIFWAVMSREEHGNHFQRGSFRDIIVIGVPWSKFKMYRGASLAILEISKRHGGPSRHSVAFILITVFALNRVCT